MIARTTSKLTIITFKKKVEPIPPPQLSKKRGKKKTTQPVVNLNTIIDAITKHTQQPPVPEAMKTNGEQAGETTSISSPER